MKRIEVKVGDVFTIRWNKGESYSIYKAYRVRKRKLTYIKSTIDSLDCVKIVNGNPYYTFFSVKVANDNECSVEIETIDGAEFIRVPRLKSILYENIMDEYWNKYYKDLNEYES